MNTNQTTLLKLIVLISFGLLLHFNYLTFFVEWLNMSSLHHHNQNYLGKVSDLATTDIINFSELLAVTEVARSSEVGISFFASFNVDIGNILHSFSTFLEKGIEVQLASLAAIEVLTLLDILAHWLSPLLFKLAILTTSLYYIAGLVFMPKSILLKLHYVGRFTIGVFLLAHVALPYSIHLSSLVSQELTQAKKQTISLSLQHTHAELTSVKKGVSLKDSAEESLHNLKSMPRKHITQKVTNVSKHVFMSIALNIFDLLIMPILLFLLLNSICIRLIPMQKVFQTPERLIPLEKKDIHVKDQHEDEYNVLVDKEVKKNESLVHNDTSKDTSKNTSTDASESTAPFIKKALISI